MRVGVKEKVANVLLLYRSGQKNTKTLGNPLLRGWFLQKKLEKAGL